MSNHDCVSCVPLVVHIGRDSVNAVCPGHRASQIGVKCNHSGHLLRDHCVQSQVSTNVNKVGHRGLTALLHSHRDRM